MVFWSSSWHHAHLVIQSYTYNHTHTSVRIQAYIFHHSMMLHTGMWRIPMRSSIWNIPMKSCTDPWSLRLHRCSSADWLSDPWPLRLSPVQVTRVMVGSLVLATATHAVPDREPGFAFFITSLRPCHLCCRVSLNSKPTPSWQFDISPQALRSSFCFNLVVFRLVRLRIVPFSVPCCPSYFCSGLRCAWLNRFWLCIKLSTVTCCCLPTRFADQSSRVCPCSSFRPQCRDVSIWRFRFLRSCCVEWFSRWLVLRLFPLPCHVVCHTFVFVRAALDQTGYASNSALSVFFLCQLKCCNASKAHWSHVLSAFTIITTSIWMSVCSVKNRETGHYLSRTTIWSWKSFRALRAIVPWFDANRITRTSFTESLSPMSLLFLTHDVVMVRDDSSTFVGRLLFVNRLQAHMC